MSAADLSGAIDITLATLPILNDGKANAVRFSTLEAIRVAPDCQPGNILSFQTESGKSP